MYRSALPNCDHCHKLRRRDDTFILKNAAGEMKQVGRNCLADFLRSGDAGDIASRLTFVFESFDAIEEFERGGYRGGLVEYDLKYFLKYVQISIRLFGWTSSAKAKENGTEATAWTAWTMNSQHCDKELRAKVTSYLVKHAWTDADDKGIEDAIAWAKAVKRENDYLHNLSAIACSEYVTEKTCALAASILPAYFRAMETEERKQEKRDGSNHFGTIGKREDFTLTLKKVLSFESQWGTTNLHIFEDANKNVAVWFASGGGGLAMVKEDTSGAYGVEAKEGDIVKVKATVKEHGARDGVKQTVLSRVKRLA
jgi:hypothetical protein